MSKTKASLCVMIATCIAVMALFFWPKAKPTTLRATTVRSGTLELACMLDGQVVYADQQVLVAPVAGQVQQVYVRSGDWVDAGDLLLRLDATLETQALEQLEARMYQMNQQMEAWAHGQATGFVTGEYLMQMEQQRQTLIAAIQAKQIRAASSGWVENLFVRPGDYVASAGILGQLRGDERCIAAVWLGQEGQTPQVGMPAWLCNRAGEPWAPLQLEQVRLSMDEERYGYQLLFRCQEDLPVGDRYPLRLILRSEEASALVPKEALDQQSRLWVIQNGEAMPLTVDVGQTDGTLIQVPTALAGSLVLLQPDEEMLAEGARVRWEKTSE